MPRELPSELAIADQYGLRFDPDPFPYWLASVAGLSAADCEGLMRAALARGRHVTDEDIYRATRTEPPPDDVLT